MAYEKIRSEASLRIKSAVDPSFSDSASNPFYESLGFVPNKANYAGMANHYMLLFVKKKDLVDK
jgi:hypothetical protein